MDQYNWSSVKEEKLNPLASRRVVHTERMTIARLALAKGAIVPFHQHENEQVTMMESGSLRFVIGDQETIVRAGEALCVPPNAPHMVEALEDCLAVDVFTPRREDWIRGDDAYLRR